MHISALKKSLLSTASMGFCCQKVSLTLEENEEFISPLFFLWIKVYVKTYGAFQHVTDEASAVVYVIYTPMYAVYICDMQVFICVWFCGVRTTSGTRVCVHATNSHFFPITGINMLCWLPPPVSVWHLSWFRLSFHTHNLHTVRVPAPLGNVWYICVMAENTPAKP